MTKSPKRWAWKIFFLFIGAIFIYQLWILGHVVFWNFYDPSTSAFMQERLGIMKKNDSRAKLYTQWVSYEHISPHLKRAIITAEDNKFLEHEGFDFEAIQKAYKKNMQRGKLLVGGSTISQQLAKNLFLSDKKTPWRKLEEVIITLMLENVMSKRRILEIYLNIIEWGNGIFGAEAAAHYYYGISSVSLTAEQSAFLTAMITNPRFYDKNRNSPQLLKKMNIILNRMALINIP
ncbi:MAG: monofunctional biosynthetic peptidoglycan transglycosylase [Nitrosospira sp.]|nr:monofunctional biosynthetic peptidoglycan transglycosylase [Nitrosospira sp.]MDW7642683.1 monofunctional biosynthetic peptidoglycan transglycosylase [Nitrosomonadaceae bacterium]MBI0417877.1 monofunctional biosynthetic peptidoglycan transglycosylase [Nitrosospira sp.]MDW7653036.1 monofunctional biosynthetic peptidoglycan transglycosylase [Nitrosomonadaceae bacterium]MDW7663460.1 monofunctional biosynthetic peptidoglycan transglycosylase [Nitrosomonadaceae bacterium]